MENKSLQIKILSLLILTLLIFTHLYCQSNKRDKFVKVFFPNGKAVSAEIAVTPGEREKGLMFRESISPDQGMLFIFEEEDFYSFWMKNTLIPLDIIWLNAHRQIVHIEKNVLPCPGDPCPSYAPLHPAKYVLELKSGQAEENGLKLFDQLSFILPDWVKK
jgi:hypothetical protein